jgi:hypothetical protein
MHVLILPHHLQIASCLGRPASPTSWSSRLVYPLPSRQHPSTSSADVRNLRCYLRLSSVVHGDILDVATHWGSILAYPRELITLTIHIRQNKMKCQASSGMTMDGATDIPFRRKLLNCSTLSHAISLNPMHDMPSVFAIGDHLGHLSFKGMSNYRPDIRPTASVGQAKPGVAETSTHANGQFLN